MIYTFSYIYGMTELKLAYVKFLQGSLTNFKALATKDPNTLYFVFDNEANPTTSALYLGERLVSGIGEGFGASSLNELSDVILSEVADRDILMFNGASWENVSFDELIDEIGARGFEVDANAFELGEDGILKLAGLADAEAGAQLVKGSDGKLSWVKPDTTTVEGLETTVTNLETNVTNLTNNYNELDGEVDTLKTNLNSLSTEVGTKANSAEVYTKNEVDTKIAMVDHMKRKIVNSVEEIDLNAHDALYYIYMVPTGKYITDDKYDEYLVVDDAGVRKVERVGSWEVDLSSYATKEELAKKVDAVEGYGLIANTEAERLAKVNENAEVNVINSVDENEFAVNDRKLELKAVPASKVANLEDLIASKQVITTVSDDFKIEDKKLSLNKSFITKAEIGNLEELIRASGKADSTLVEEINFINERLTWQAI